MHKAINESHNNDFVEEYDKDNNAENISFKRERKMMQLYYYENGIGGFCFSKTGKSHLMNNTICQDSSKMIKIKNFPAVVTAIADGVGSCALSDFGSECAVNAVTEYIEKKMYEVIEKTNNVLISERTAGDILRGAMSYAYDEVEKKAVSMDQMVFSLQSTLTVSILINSDLYFAHAGDDGIVVMTNYGRLEMVTVRHKGQEASSVYPLQNKSTWQFGHVKNVSAIIMATDGVLDAFVKSKFEQNRIYYPFIEPIFTANVSSSQDIKSLCKMYSNIMNGDSYRSNVTDDITFAAIVNWRDMKNISLPSFDKNEWERQTEAYAKKRTEALYPLHEHQKKTDEEQQTVSVSQSIRKGQTEKKEDLVPDFIKHGTPEKTSENSGSRPESENIKASGNEKKSSREAPYSQSRKTTDNTQKSVSKYICCKRCNTVQPRAERCCNCHVKFNKKEENKKENVIKKFFHNVKKNIDGLFIEDETE